jgi:hypothetical protein
MAGSLSRHGRPEAASTIRRTTNVPIGESISDYGLRTFCAVVLSPPIPVVDAKGSAIRMTVTVSSTLGPPPAGIEPSYSGAGRLISTCPTSAVFQIGPGLQTFEVFASYEP